ncbi:hypothetical protein Q1695_016456 [Nippostrongylus brasiliensis]|nr:hypothetical protein Q1695_016456 [Nippostrongylus brasiliensis]
MYLITEGDNHVGWASAHRNRRGGNYYYYYAYNNNYKKNYYYAYNNYYKKNYYYAYNNYYKKNYYYARTTTTPTTTTTRRTTTTRTTTTRRTTTSRRPPYNWQQPAPVACVRRGNGNPSRMKWTTNYIMQVPPVKFGDTLSVSGVFYHNDMSKFAINLVNAVCVLRYEGDNYAHGLSIPLHVDTRFRNFGHFIAINALTAGVWGKEQRVGNPFKEGQQFNFKIRVRQHAYVIKANGRQLHRFMHRMPISVIRQVWLYGGAKLSQVCWNERCNYVNGR